MLKSLGKVLRANIKCLADNKWVFYGLDLQSVLLLVVVGFSAVGLFMPFFLSLLGFWLWFPDKLESIIFELSDFFLLEVSQSLFSFER